MSADAAEVLAERRGALGVLTLNRPRAINALTHDMVRLIAAALDAWETDDAVRTVAIVGAGERGLCAGGDVIGLHADVTGSDGSGAAEFWRDEYRLNARLGSYPKPIVALQDGLVLGGGIGISGHASHRIVTERSRLGFPEVTIGFVPDVGATWLLSRAPGELGTRLALTADTVGAADAIALGLSDWFVASEHLPALLRDLESADADVMIAAWASEPGRSALAAERVQTDADFGGQSVGEIIDALRRRGTEAAALRADGIAAKSPLASAVTLAALRRARTLTSLEDALALEFRLSTHAAMAPDFAEGIRAQLIDKDRRPRWSPASLAEIPEGRVEEFFAPSAFGDLEFVPPLADAKEHRS